jgi:hypothetical protein
VVEVIRGPHGHIVVDAQHFPLMFTKFVGEVSRDMFAEYFNWVRKVNERARRADIRVITVSDISRGKRPPVDVRKFVAEEQDRVVETYGSTNMASYIVVENALVRGALTAIGWSTKKGLDATPVRSIGEGIDRAFADFDANRIERPRNLRARSYAFPEV